MKPPVKALGAYQYFDLKPALHDMRSAVLAGLAQIPKHVSPMYFYNEAGSVLFEKITQLPEYYPTRTEMSLFDQYGFEIAEHLGSDLCLVEYGAGASLKIRKLLESTHPVAYLPVDISGEHLQGHARSLQRDFPSLQVYPTCADFTAPFELPDAVSGLTIAGFFPGSSIGNFEPPQAKNLLSNMARTLGSGSRLLIGVDRKKDHAVLQAAYDDAAGVTAEFNLNILTHLNQSLGANFDVTAFSHRAIYNSDIGAIQMFLVSDRAQQVQVADVVIDFAKGEALHTENSFKYHPDEFSALAAEQGFAVTAHWTDRDDYFSLFLLTVE